MKKKGIVLRDEFDDVIEGLKRISDSLDAFDAFKQVAPVNYFDFIYDYTGCIAQFDRPLFFKLIDSAEGNYNSPESWKIYRELIQKYPEPELIDNAEGYSTTANQEDLIAYLKSNIIQLSALIYFYHENFLIFDYCLDGEIKPQIEKIKKEYTAFKKASEKCSDGDLK